MHIIKDPFRHEYHALLQRPYADNSAVLQSVQHILKEVRLKGDDALYSFAREFDGVELHGLQVSSSEIARAAEALSPALKIAIQQARANIEKFHATQLTQPEK